MATRMAFVAFVMSTVCFAVSPVNGECADPQRNTRTATPHETALVGSNGGVVLPTGNTQLNVFGGVSDIEVEDVKHTTDNEQAAELQNICDADVARFVGDNRELVRSRGAGNATQSSPRDMLFFLHAPRTAGSTFLTCFLQPATPPSKRCDLSYDVLRLNVSASGCGLLSSHDDYSVTKFLPDASAVATQVRDPVARLLSAYEFVVGIAAAQVNKQSKVPMTKPGTIVTGNVWPWSEIIPWVEGDMLARVEKVMSTAVYTPTKQWVEHRDARTGRVYYHNYYTRRSVWSLSPEDGIVVPALDPYDNPLAMPLREFIEHPLVRDNLHNGQSLQLLGLTTYSHLNESSKLRSCISGLPDVREAMTEAALARLETLLHVGVSDRLEDSIASAATSLGIKLDGPSWKTPPSESDDANVPDVEELNERMNQTKTQLEAKIEGITEDIAAKGRDFRRARFAIKRVQEEAQSAGVDQLDGAAEEEVSQLVALTERLNDEIGELREQISELKVKIVRLKIPQPEVRSAARQITKDDDELLNPANVAQNHEICAIQGIFQNKHKWRSYAGLMTVDGRSFFHSSETRKHISPEIIDRIRQLNSMDVELYKAAQRILTESLDRQAIEGTRQVMSPPKPLLQNFGISQPPLPTEEIDRPEIAETAEVHKSTEAVPESPQADELRVDDGQESQAYLTSGVNAAAEELHSNKEHQQHDSFEAECPLEHTTSHDEL